MLVDDICKKCGAEEFCKETKCAVYKEVLKLCNQIMNDKQREYLENTYINNPELFIGEFYAVRKLNETDWGLLRRLLVFKEIDKESSVYTAISQELYNTYVRRKESIE